MSQQDNTRLVVDRASEGVGVLRDVVRYVGEQTYDVARLLWRQRLDVMLSLVAGLAVAAYALFHWARVDQSQLLTVFDVWFESDMPRIAQTLSDRVSCLHARTSVHPLTSLFLSTPLILLQALGISPAAAMTLYVGAGAFAFGGLLYAALRTMGTRRLEALAVTALAATSAGGVHWLSTPENFSWGAASILVAMIWLAAPRGRHDAWTGPAQSAISMMVTVSNWMAGLAAAVVAVGVRRAIAVSATGLLIVALLTPVQSALFPNAGGFLNVRQELMYSVANSDKAQLAPVNRLLAMFDHVLVAPDVQILPQNEPLAPFKLSYQSLQVANGPVAAVALAGWLGLLGLGVWSMARGRVRKDLAVGVGAVLAGNVLLHLVYGEEVFLYAMHFVTLFALIVGFATRGPRWLIVPVIVATATASHVNNSQHFDRVVDVVNSGRLRPRIEGPLLPPCGPGQTPPPAPTLNN